MTPPDCTSRLSDNVQAGCAVPQPVRMRGDFFAPGIGGPMLKDDTGAAMRFYRRLVLDFCFPSGDESTEHLLGEPEPNARQRRRHRIDEEEVPEHSNG